MNPFTPTVYLGDFSVTTSSQRQLLDTRYEQAIITTTVGTYIRFGSSSVTASTTGMFVPAGAVITISYGPQGNNSYMAYIGTGTGTINITCGEGA